MREKLAPWMPALFCAVLSTIVILEQLFVAFRNGTTQSIPTTFLCFLPMSFFFVGNFLAHLQKENDEIKKRFDELSSQIRCGNQTRDQLEV